MKKSQPTATHREMFSTVPRNRNTSEHLFRAVCSLLLAVIVVYSLQQSLPHVVQASKRSKDLGSTLFHQRGCEHCHGVDGQGGDLGPDLSTIGKRWSKQQIQQQIYNGGAGMPAFRNSLQPDEVKDLVDFLHAKRKAPRTSAAIQAVLPSSEPIQ